MGKKFSRSIKLFNNNKYFYLLKFIMVEWSLLISNLKSVIDFNDESEKQLKYILGKFNNYILTIDVFR